TDTGVGELGGELFRVSRHKSPGDCELSGTVGGGSQPSLQCVMYPLAGCTSSDKQNLKPPVSRARLITGEEYFVVKTILVAHQLLGRETFVDEGFSHKIGRTEQVVGQSVFLFFNPQNLRIVRVFVLWRQRDSDAIAFGSDD